MSEPSPETPWDVVKRMRAEGHPRETIHARLTAMGLEADDIKVLMMEDPPKGAPGMDLGPLGAVAAVAVGGPLIGALAIRAMSESVVEREEAGPQAPLAATDPSTRCAVHPELASVGTCPRCGVFACRTCAPKTGFAKDRLCAACDAQPAVREERVRGAARWVSVSVFCFVGLLGVELMLASGSEKLLLVVGFLAAVALPLVALGLVQLWVRSRWPGIAAGVYALGLLVLSLWGGRDLVTCLWVLVIGGLIAALQAMGTARAQWLTRTAPPTTLPHSTR